MFGEIHLIVLRVFLASLVILHHSFYFAGSTDPLHAFGTSLGEVGVVCFFFLSGALLAKKSVEGSLTLFITRRVVRIWPALALGSTLAAILGLASQIAGNTPVSPFAYVSYLYTNLSLINPNRQYLVEGAFSGNRGAGILNGSLWSITFEVWCYIALCIAVVLSRKSLENLRVVAFASFGLLMATAVLVENTQAVQLAGWIYHLLPGFFLGVFFGTYERNLRAFSSAAAWTLAFVLVTVFADFQLNGSGLTFERGGWVIATLIAAYAYSVKIEPSKVPDPTLGLYVYSYPVGQALAHLTDTATNAALIFSITILIALPLALISYRYIEWPVMKRINPR